MGKWFLMTPVYSSGQKIFLVLHCIPGSIKTARRKHATTSMADTTTMPESVVDVFRRFEGQRLACCGWNPYTADEATGHMLLLGSEEERSIHMLSSILELVDTRSAMHGAFRIINPDGKGKEWIIYEWMCFKCSMMDGYHKIPCLVLNFSDASSVLYRFSTVATEGRRLRETFGFGIRLGENDGISVPQVCFFFFQCIAIYDSAS